MRIKLPKELRGLSFPRITTIEFNDFDVDLLLPSLFFRILAEGNGRARRTNDATAIDNYVHALATHPLLEGFDGQSGERVLQKFVRTSLAITGRTGAQRNRTEQILAVAPYSVLSHKTGLPAEGSRQRNVDTFLYQVLRDRSGTESNLRRFITQVFGKGVLVERAPELGGRYDGATELDTLTRLSLAFLDGFQPTASGRRLGRIRAEACPSLVAALGGDLQHYLYTFYERMPPQALTYHLLGLINFELFVYTLKLVHAVNQLVRAPDELPPAMRQALQASAPDLYVDFTGAPGSLSQQMATAGVRRDIDAYGQFFVSLLTLRQLDRYAEILGRNPRLVGGLQTLGAARSSMAPDYLKLLLATTENPVVAASIEALAMSEEEAIRQLNRKVAQEEDASEEDSLAWLNALLPPHLNAVQRVIALLAESQKRALWGLSRWYQGVGGLVKPQGILAGTPTGKRAWRYQPSNDLLAVWVQLASIQLRPEGDGQDHGPRPIPLREFLAFLHDRFGILIDRPPEPFSGAEHVAAARDNLRAMLRRLRQMGVFRDLSDDFTVQALQPPYATVDANP
jgi:hypothetical protein